MFAVLIPILAGLDIVLKYAVNSMDKKELPRTFAKKIEIDKFHNDGFVFGKLKKRKKIVKYVPVFITSILVGVLAVLLPKKGNKIRKLSLSLSMEAVNWCKLKPSVVKPLKISCEASAKVGGSAKS